MQPRSKDNLNLYELLYGRLFQAPVIPGTLYTQGNVEINKYLISLGHVLQVLQKIHGNLQTTETGRFDALYPTKRLGTY